MALEGNIRCYAQTGLASSSLQTENHGCVLCIRPPSIVDSPFCSLVGLEYLHKEGQGLAATCFQRTPHCTSTQEDCPIVMPLMRRHPKET